MAYVRDHIKNPDCKFYRTSNGLFVLHYACEQGAGGAFISHFFSVDVILELLRAGFDINQPDIYGRTPLHWAALLLDCDLFVLLVQAGADLHKRSLVVALPFFNVVWKDAPLHVLSLHEGRAAPSLQGRLHRSLLRRHPAPRHGIGLPVHRSEASGASFRRWWTRRAIPRCTWRFRWRSRRRRRRRPR